MIVLLLYASSKVSRSLCIPILLGIIKGLVFSSSRSTFLSSLALSFKFVFLVNLVLGLLGVSSSCCGCCALPDDDDELHI